MRWIEEELAGEHVIVQVARTARDIVRALIQDPPPRAQLLVADLDAMSASDVLGVHAIRDRGWFGSLIALGEVADELRGTLNIAHVLRRPLGSEGLRKAVTQLGLEKPTTKMPRLVRP
ncbi:MAG: hypothetical protein ACM31C_30225 [Acidobacteriota bacterium]